MKQLLQNLRDGKTEIVDVPVPTPQKGMVLVRTGASLVSVGTERMLVEFAEKSLIGKAQSRPDLVRQVLDKARREGILPTVNAAFNRLDQPMSLGYSSAGTIVEVGEDVQGYKVGQRVACAGGGYAAHAEYVVVPQNLLAPVPDHVAFESAAFGTLGSIAMHGFRLGEPQLGDDVVVIGLGLLGLITVGLAKAAGCRVLGIDLDPVRVALAEEMGAEAVIRDQAEDAVLAFSDGKGMDLVLITAATSSNDPVELAGLIARDRAKVVAIGDVGMAIPRRTYFYKELEFIVSRSYGPGRYDPNYEEGGQDYPVSYVRWTAGRNLASFMSLLGDGKLELQKIISHRFPIAEAPKAYELITGKIEEDFLGVVITYPEHIEEAAKSIVHIKRKQVKDTEVNLGMVGAGLFAGATMLPALKKQKNLNLVGIASASGLSAQHAAKKFGFEFSTSDLKALLEDDQINTLAILTRHNLHADQTLAGLAAGKHVFVEKPLALNLEELDLVIETAVKPDAPMLMVGYNRRFAPLAMKMKDFMDQRAEPIVAHYRVNAGFLPPEHWLHDLEQGGGRIVGEGCHFIDFLIWLIGDLPVSVSAQGLPDGGRYYEDNVVMTFTFRDGSIGTLSYLANGDKLVPKEVVEVFAGGRVARLDDFRSVELVNNGRRQVHKSRLGQDKGHAAEWGAFIDAICSTGTPPIPYAELEVVSKASFAAVEALRQGGSIEIK